MLGIYTRLSVEDGVSNSIKNQLLEGEKFAKEKDFTYQIYNEGEGLSGKLGLDKRPQLKKLFEDIIEGQITKVWFRDSNRLSRNELLYHQSLEIFRKQETEVYFGDKHFDYNSPSANMMQSIKATFDAMKILEQSVATKKAIKGRLERGEVQGTIPLGYKSDNGLLVIDESTAPIVREIFNKSLNGMGSVSISNWLTEQKVPTKISKSNKWSHTSVIKMIKNELYKGVRVYGGVEYIAPSIVSDVLWHKANKHLQDMRQYTGKPTYHKYLLSNMLKCGKCNYKVSGRKINTYNKDKSIKHSHHSYACISTRKKNINCGSPSINLYKLDDLIWTKFVMDNSLSKLITSHFKATNNNDNLIILKSSLKALRTSKNKLSKDKDKLIQLVLDGVLSNEDTKAKMNAIKSSIKDTDTKILNTKEQIQSYEGSLNDLDSILSDLSINSEYSFNDKQEILRKYVKNITLYYLDGLHFIEISFNILNMEAIVYVVDSKYNFAFRMATYDEYESATKGSVDSTLNFDAFVWNEEYSDLTKWLSMDTYYKTNKMFLFAKYGKEAILKAIGK